MTTAPSHEPIDLGDLRRRYDELPAKSVRWKTDVGREFLDLVDAATSDYPVRIVAEALGMTHQGIYVMRWRRRQDRTENWPSEEQLRDFRAAWRVVEARRAQCQYVRRNSRAFEDVHVALMALRSTFSYRVVTRALNIPSRDLKRFLDSPLHSPAEVEELATLINLHHELRSHPTVITPVFTAALRRAALSVSITKIANALDTDVTSIEHVLGESDCINS